MGVQILIADVDAYDPALPGVVTLRFATQGYATGPADSPAHTSAICALSFVSVAGEAARMYRSRSGHVAGMTGGRFARFLA